VVLIRCEYQVYRRAIRRALILLNFTQVTSLSHPRPYLISNYTNAVSHLTSILQRFELSEFYTHHIDLLHFYLECPDISQNFVNQVLDLWLIESDGDIKPLLSFSRDKVVRRLLASGIFILMSMQLIIFDMPLSLLFRFSLKKENLELMFLLETSHA